MERSCVQEDLIAYHLATLPAARQDLIEQHLLRCSTCLRAYLLLKREMDHGIVPDQDTARPSEAARLRLREAVRQRFAPRDEARLWRRLWLLWSRPIPLYTGVFAVVLGVLLLHAGSLLWERPWAQGDADGGGGGTFEAVDSARQQTTNVVLY